MISQSVALDHEFDSDGKVKIDLNNTHDIANAVAVDPNGKIIVAGNSDFYDFAVVRINPDGSPDTSFSHDGKLIVDFNQSNDQAYSVLVTADLKILIGGFSRTTNNQGMDYDFALVRINYNGELDSTFGVAGKMTIDLGCFSDMSYCMKMQSDGKIVLGGAVNWKRALCRINNNGTPDLTFGQQGKVVTNVPGLGKALAIQNDGKILLCGDSYDFTLCRFNANGTLDSSFGNAGIVSTDVAGVVNSSLSVAVQDDEKIVLAGHTYNGLDRDLAMLRYDVTGNIDTSFGLHGVVVSDLGYNEIIKSTVINDNGKILACGYTDYTGDGDTDFILASYNPDGSRDSSFGLNGTVITKFDNLDSYGNAMAIQSDKKIILAGKAGGDFAVVRYFYFVLKEKSENIYVQNSFVTYPNPSKGAICITGKIKDCTIQVCDVNGKIIYSTKNIPENKVEIDPSKNAKGIYFVSIISAEAIQSRKIIIE